MKEYLYTNFEPFDAHRLFPCFDQPDIKAKYSLTIRAPREVIKKCFLIAFREWQIVSNYPMVQLEYGNAEMICHSHKWTLPFRFELEDNFSLIRKQYLSVLYCSWSLC